MFKWISNIGMYAGYIVAIFAAVRDLGGLFEVPKHGKEKREAVLQAIGILLEGLGGTVGGLTQAFREKLLSIAGKAIEIWVEFDKLTGLWGKKETTAEEVVGNS